MRKDPKQSAVRWVFGYGSLMWRPGFDYVERRHATLFGAHRSLCVYSHVHRGTPEKPGLVLGLNRGGACNGVAFRISDEGWPRVVDYLRAREQVTNVYKESVRAIRLAAKPEQGPRSQGRGNSLSATTTASDPIAEALCYVVDRRHHQFAGNLPLHTMVELVLRSTGRSGHNRDYVLNTVTQLAEMRVRDPNLVTLAERLRKAVALSL